MLDRVFTAEERSFDQLEHVAIAITQLRGHPTQHHIGVMHKDMSTGRVSMLHLAWHHDLKDSDPKASYAWVVPSIPRPRARQVAAFCRKVKKANPSGVPYAFSHASDCLNIQTGAYVGGPGHYGLTCATFVLAIFDATGLPLVQYGTWPDSRDGDDEWRSCVIESLKSSGATSDHIARVESEMTTVRYRPVDVAGAAASSSIPACYDEANKIAAQIMSKIKRNNCIT